MIFWQVLLLLKTIRKKFYEILIIIILIFRLSKDLIKSLLVKDPTKRLGHNGQIYYQLFLIYTIGKKLKFYKIWK